MNKKRLMFIIVCFVIALGSISCQVGSHTPYNLMLPTEGHQLSEKLNEISGIHYQNDSTVLAIQDEKARIYFLNPNDGEINTTYSFGKKGDFEGITSSGEDIYVLKSNGDIMQINMATEKTDKYGFKDSKGFDFEGLCLDAANDRLLVACKKHADKDKNDHIRIYAFDLGTRQYEKKPVYKLAKSHISAQFKPSGIAIHPNGSVYILSSTAKMLMAISTEGEVLWKEVLPESIFNQPEGITFSPEGDLFISNEKKNKYPTLLKFVPNEY